MLQIKDYKCILSALCFHDFITVFAWSKYDQSCFKFSMTKPYQHVWALHHWDIDNSLHPGPWYSAITTINHDDFAAEILYMHIAIMYGSGKFVFAKLYLCGVPPPMSWKFLKRNYSKLCVSQPFEMHFSYFFRINKTTCNRYIIYSLKSRTRDLK